MMGNSSSGEVDMSGDEAKFVQSEISHNCVVIFSKSYCPHCRASKSTFQKMGVDFTNIELDKRSDGDAIQDILGGMTGARTVPRVFINGKCIGGNSETQKLYSDGKLEQMIKDCK